MAFKMFTEPTKIAQMVMEVKRMFSNSEHQDYTQFAYSQRWAIVGLLFH